MARNLTGLRVAGSTEASVTLASSTTETVVGTAITIPANTLNDGDVIDGYLAINISTTGTPTINLQFRVDATDVIETGALTTGSSLSAVGWVVRYRGTVRSTGATGTIMWAVACESNDAPLDISKVDTTADSIDTTQDNDVDVTGTWSANSASNTLTASQHVLEIHGNAR